MRLLLGTTCIILFAASNSPAVDTSDRNAWLIIYNTNSTDSEDWKDWFVSTHGISDANMPECRLLDDGKVTLSRTVTGRAALRCCVPVCE